MMFDIHIAGYVLNSTSNKYTLEALSQDYLNYDITGFENASSKNQLNLFEIQEENKLDVKKCAYTYVIYRLYDILTNKLKESNEWELFTTIEMPLVEVLADMEYEGVYVDKEELKIFGKELEIK